MGAAARAAARGDVTARSATSAGDLTARQPSARQTSARREGDVPTFKTEDYFSDDDDGDGDDADDVGGRGQYGDTDAGTDVARGGAAAAAAAAATSMTMPTSTAATTAAAVGTRVRTTALIMTCSPCGARLCATVNRLSSGGCKAAAGPSAHARQKGGGGGGGGGGAGGRLPPLPRGGSAATASARRRRPRRPRRASRAPSRRGAVSPRRRRRSRQRVDADGAADQVVAPAVGAEHRPRRAAAPPVERPDELPEARETIAALKASRRRLAKEVQALDDLAGSGALSELGRTSFSKTRLVTVRLVDERLAAEGKTPDHRDVIRLASAAGLKHPEALVWPGGLRVVFSEESVLPPSANPKQPPSSRRG